jgi:FkbM family methyltransferase
MIRESLLHFAHTLKWKLNQKASFSGRGILLKLSDRIIDEPRIHLTIRTIYGFKMAIDPVKDKGVERSIFYTGTYEAGTLRIFDFILKPGDNFIDVGANIGLMSLFVANKIGKSGMVHSFEPEPDTFKILSNNISLNKLKNIYLNKWALGSKKMEGIIYPNFEINRGASSIVKKDSTAGKPINIITLDEYIKNKKVDKVALIKIDIEGYELEMLQGAIKLLNSKEAPIICIEYSQDVESVGSLSDVYEFIIGINHYRIFKFVGWKGDLSNLKEVFTKEEMPENDNVFCFLPRHLLEISKIIFE